MEGGEEGGESTIDDRFCLAYRLRLKVPQASYGYADSSLPPYPQSKQMRVGGEKWKGKRGKKVRAFQSLTRYAPLGRPEIAR